MSKENVEAKKTMSYWVHSIICVSLMIGVGFLPPLGGQITQFGMQALGVFLGTFYGWIFIEFMWPSLLGMVVLGLTSYGTIGSVFTEGIMNESTLNILIMFIFAAYLEHCGTVTYITNWLVSRKMWIGKPWLFTAVFMCAIIPMAVFVNIYAGIILLWGMFAILCKQLGYTKNDMYVTYVITGISAIGALVSLCFPFQPFSQLVFNLSGPTVGVTELPFMKWTALGLCTMVLIPISYIFLGKYILRVDASKIANMGDFFAEYRDRKMSKDEKFGAGLLLFFIALIVLPSLTSGNVKAFFANFKIIGAGLLCITIALIYQIKQGKDIFTFGKMVREGVNWDLIILFVCTFPLCTALESSESGVVSTIIASLMPIVNSVSPAIFLIIVSLVLCVATQFAHNLVFIIALTPSLAKICVNVGMDPILFALIFCQAMLIAFATPAASANSAMVFGYTEWVDRKYAYKVGISLVLIFLFVDLALLLPIGLLIF